MMKNFCLILTLVLISFSSCVSLNYGKKKISRNLSEKGICSEKTLVKFFMANNPSADKNKVKRLAFYYVNEAREEGINSDCAWVQMCHETGFLRFGNLVTPEMNNFCGLGSIDKNNKGLSFETEQLGVRAHIQHLHAYATDSEVTLKNPCIDPRYRYVNPRGKAKDIHGLAGTWAADRLYGEKLEKHLSNLEKF